MKLHVLGCTFDTECYLKHSESQQHCKENQCMSFIGEPCEDGNLCYNNIGQTSYGTVCVESVCKVVTRNECNHDVDCALGSDKCIDQKCTPTICDCKDYQECTDYKCISKTCTTSSECVVDGGNLDAFCYENSCRPLASFGGHCGVSSDCGESMASCVDGICAIPKPKEDTHDNNKEYVSNDVKSSFTGGFITGFLVATFLGFAVFIGVKTKCISECFESLLHKIRYGAVSIVEGEIVSENNDTRTSGKEIQLSSVI